MYGDVVMGLKPVSKEDHDPFEVIIDMVKEQKGVQLDTELDTDDLKELVQRFKALIRARIGRDFPDRPLGAAVGRGDGRCSRAGTTTAPASTAN